MTRRAILDRMHRDDSGFTLVEVILALVLSVVLGGVVLSMLIATGHSSNATVSSINLTGEARDLLNRLSGDIRRATPVWNGTTEIPAVVAVQNPYPGGTPNQPTSITIDADVNGDGCIAGVTSNGCDPATHPVDPNNPETETFCWSPATQQVYLISGAVVVGGCTPASGATAQPLLSGKVTDFELTYAGSNYLYDTNADGITTWQELDQAGPPVGNDNGILDGPELTSIDSIGVSVTVSDQGHQQVLRTSITVRNAT